MSPVNLDFANMEESEFGAVPAGDYECTIFEINSKTSKAGNPMLEFIYKRKEGGGQFWDYYTLTPNALWKIKGLLQRMGYSDEELEGSMQFDEKELLGRPVIVRVKETEYNGKPSNEVTDVFDPDQVPASGGWG